MPQSKTDIIVIGSGAAGSVVAARLSENPNLNITVLEAGKADRHPFIHIPAGFIKMIFNTRYIWPFKTQPDPTLGEREINVLQGRVVGGSGSINGLIYNRGLPSDYDGWAAMGNPGWDYASVLPFFKKSETFLGQGDPKLRGKDGPMPVSELEWKPDICEAFIDGAGELGIPRNADYNGERQHGAGYFQRIIKGRWRVSSAKAFLKPALKRPNLTLITRAVAAKILFDGKRAIGVEYITREGRGETKTLMANRQVVLSCGTVNTARLLQISGVGRKADLEKIGVPLVHELDGVGQNLRDHFSVRMVARAKNAVTINEIAKIPRLLWQQMRWLFGLPSLITISPSLVHIFAKSDESQTEPDLQGVFAPASYKAGFVSVLDKYPGFTCGFWAHKPESTGFVRALSSDPMGEVHIQPNYLTAPRDIEMLLRAVKLGRALFRTSAMSNYFDFEQLPGEDVQSDAELEAFARQYGVSSWHLVGTAKMGPSSDPTAVVDNQLSVHGLDSLTIADASVMPNSPSANTFAATVMIGEKAADMLKSKLA